MNTQSSGRYGIDIKEVLSNLLRYCRANQWSGYDPYDALNSQLFQLLPVVNKRLPRIAVTQALKRSPINIRPLALIPKKQNPKALALFLSGLLKLSTTLVPDRDQLCRYMIDRIAALQSPNSPYWCWGYSFPWQTRENIVPAYTPNLVCTTFVANALIDAYEAGHGHDCLKMAESAAEYILNELYWTDGNSVAGFSYPLRSLRVQVHNANFLAAALLCRVRRCTGNNRFLDPALKVARYSASQQEHDGAWYYGEASFQRWIDNFHTGYNLCALQSIARSTGTSEFDVSMHRGLEYYCAHFFREDGAARYFHTATYPIDIHSIAQSIITLMTFRDIKPDSVALAQLVLHWALEHMWDDRGFFYYRALRLTTIRISYMRWSQAWMFLALAIVLSDSTQIAQPQIAESLTVSSEA